ncbi:MAG: hypothetical protein ACI8RD_010865, partial [Bacillariaceae sp.]
LLSYKEKARRREGEQNVEQYGICRSTMIAVL